MKGVFFLVGVLISLLLLGPPVPAQNLEQHSPIYRELSEKGVMTTGQIVDIFGVPSVEVIIPSGETIKSFVHSVPSLKRKSHIVVDRIALLNKTHYLCIMNDPGNMGTDRNKLFIPLNYDIEPKILPYFLSEASEHEKFILINRRLQYLGLYEKGFLKHVFPISSGTSKSTPLRNFVVSHMNEFHNSSLFDQAPMDLAINIGGNYFIHEGIVPGYPASHGCVRIFPLHARFLFYKWAKPGVPGKITD